MVERRLEHAEPTGEAGRQLARDRAERPATRHRLEDVTVHLAILLVARLEQPGAAQGQEPVPEDRLRLAWTIREADPVGLRSAVKKVFRDRSLVHRRQWHKRENVVSYLPKSAQGDWRRRASTSNRASARW